MSKITLQSLTLINFKGVRELKVNFSNTTNVFGENATGKTSIFDGFLWLLFGKDSTDRKDFEVKTLDKAGNVIERIEHEVSAKLDIDGQLTELKRVLREKWTKKRGTEIPEFTGNETLYFWNDVPMKQNEYEAKINGILNEGTFKLITNPLYYNSLKWQDRRKVLMEIAGHISDAEVAAGNAAFSKLIASLSNKTIEEYKREVAAKRKGLKEQLEIIPTRIDEANRSMPEPLDFEALEFDLKNKLNELSSIDEKLLNDSKAQKARYDLIREKQQSIHQIGTAIQNKGFEIKSTIQATKQTSQQELIGFKSQLRSSYDELNSLERNKTRLETNIANLKNDMGSYRARWHEANASELTFNENEFCCPTCSTPYPMHEVEERKQSMTETFNSNKAKELQSINEKGVAAKKDHDATENSLFKLNEQISDLKLVTIIGLEAVIEEREKELLDLDKSIDQKIAAELESNADIKVLNEKKVMIEAELEALENQTESGESDQLKSRKQGVNATIDELKRNLSTKETIEKQKQRISQLESEEKSYSTQLSELEGIEYAIEQFNKAKMDVLTSRINGKFRYVTFKLFDTQINGGEVETCETLVNGVPFSDVNNAAKINAGLDIIHTLCNHYNVTAPIFIDNRESVNTLVPIESQIVNLIVSTDKSLRVA